MTLLLQGAPAGGEPLLSWLDVLLEYVGFAGYFAVYGALGYRFAVLRGDADGDAAAPGTLAGSARTAAGIGALGALLMLVRQLVNTALNSAHEGKSFVEAASGGGQRFFVPLACALLLLCGFALARSARAGWMLAALAGVVLALRNVTTGRWFSLVNPLHEVAASLWLGTLFVLLVAGLPAVLRGAREQRGALVAMLVTRFSPLALGAAGLLVVTGVTTALRHLKPFSSLWSTPYGWALCVKLCCVLMVVALGAWNWRRMTPRLGSEEGALGLRRSARAELIAGALVLLVTGVLVSLPSPRPPGAGPERPGGPGGPPPTAAPQGAH
jgi:putative copper export protein